MGLSKATIAIIYIGLLIGIPVVCWIIAVMIAWHAATLIPSRFKTLLSGRIPPTSLGDRIWYHRHHGFH